MFLYWLTRYMLHYVILLDISQSFLQMCFLHKLLLNFAMHLFDLFCWWNFLFSVFLKHLLFFLCLTITFCCIDEFILKISLSKQQTAWKWFWNFTPPPYKVDMQTTLFKCQPSQKCFDVLLWHEASIITCLNFVSWNL